MLYLYSIKNFSNKTIQSINIGLNILILTICLLFIGCGSTSNVNTPYTEEDTVTQDIPFQLRYLEINENFTNIEIPSYEKFLVQGNFITEITIGMLNLLVNIQSLYSDSHPNEYKIPALEDKYNLKWGYHSNIKLHKLSYLIENPVTQQPIQVSGLLVVPSSNKSLPIYLFAPGSRLGNNAAVPSNGVFLESYTSISTIAASFSDVAVFVPDYVGWGDSSETLHYYINSSSSIQTCLNGILAAMEYATSLVGQPTEFHLSGDVIFSGYSQGGGVALNTAVTFEKEASRFPQLKSKAVIPMAGGYHLPTLVNYVLSQDSYATPTYFPYALISNNPIYNFYPSNQNGIQNILKESVATDISNCIISGDFDLSECNTKIGVENIKSIWKSSFLDSIIESFTTPNFTIPVHQFMYENSSYYIMNNWSPKSELGYRFYHCTNDEQTFHHLADYFVSQINTKFNANATLIAPSDGNHGDCVLPSVLDALFWIKSHD